MRERDSVAFAALLLAPSLLLSVPLSPLLPLPLSPLLSQTLTQFLLGVIYHGNTGVNFGGLTFGASCFAPNLAPEKSSSRSSPIAPSCIPRSVTQSSSSLADYCHKAHILSSIITTEVSIIATDVNKGDIVTFPDVTIFC